MLGRTVLAAIEVIAACVAVYYGVRWYLEPHESHEPAFALAAFVLVVTDLIRRYVSSTQIDPERLAHFIREGQALRARLDEDPLPIREHNDWVDRMVTYFKRHKGRAYEARLSDFSHMTFYGDGSERSRMSNSIEGRLSRLHQFITELSSE